MVQDAGESGGATTEMEEGWDQEKGTEEAGVEAHRDNGECGHGGGQRVGWVHREAQGANRRGVACRGKLCGV